jgi:uncharacterized protein (TIGR02145 family)
MKKKILVLLFAFVLSVNLRAQVTIGELVDPSPGTILDLNKAVKGGLILSNVKLEKLYEIPSDFPKMTANPDLTVKNNFTGAMVYHTGVDNIPAGIYVWNGTNWTPVEENCTPRTPALLTLMGPPLGFAKADNDVTFSVSTGASAFCSQGESYEWYKTGAGNENYALISGETASSLTTSFSPAGTYKVKAVVTNCYTAAPIEKIATVEITPDDAPPVTLIDGQYSIPGDFCYDVKGPKPSSQSDEYYNSRKDAFLGDAFTKTYTFTYTNDFSNLAVLNPGGIVASVSQPAVTFATGSGSVSFTVTFVPDVKDRVVANNGPVYIQLLVGFKNNSGIDKVAYKIIKVQDAVCGCPVQVGAAQWLTFQCRNLGAIHDITSDADLMSITNINFREYHGDWYRFGAKNVSLVNDGTYEASSTISNWTTSFHASYPFQDDSHNWDTNNDPCPAGWHLPTDAEWSAVASYNASTVKHYVNGVETTTDWQNNPAPIPGSGYNDVIKIGAHLYLPAAGSRYNISGRLINRGSRGYYWSSSASDSNGRFLSFDTGAPYTDGISRSYGLSVRCVSSE